MANSKTHYIQKSHSLLSAVTADDVCLVKEILNGNYYEYNFLEQDSSGLNCLHIAALNGYYEIASELLKKYEDFVDSLYKYNYRTGTALHLASAEGHINVIELLVEHGAEINARTCVENLTALHVAAARGQAASIEVLLRYGADVHARDWFGNTALFFTVLGVTNINKYNKYFDTDLLFLGYDERAKDMANLFIKSGADVDRLCNNRETVLMTLARARLTSPELMRVFLRHKPKVLIRSYDKSTLLHVVAFNGNAHLIDILVLDVNVDVNAKTRYGLTALETAYNLSKLKVVRRLLDFDCTLDIKLLNEQFFSRIFVSDYVRYFDPLLKHFIKLSAINRYSSPGIIYRAMNIYYYNNEILLFIEYYRKLCDEQAEVLKELTVSGGDLVRRITCYDVLVNNIDWTVARLRHFDQASIHQTDVSRVSEYSEMVKCKLLVACRRMSLINTFMNHFQGTEPRPALWTLPATCIYRLIGYLTNSDLQNLNNAVTNEYNYIVD